MDENFNLIAKHELATLKGMYALPASADGSPRLMVAISLRDENKIEFAELKSAVLKDGKLCWE